MKFYKESNVMLETEFEQRIEELKVILRGRATEVALWLHALQRADGTFWNDWTLFFKLDHGLQHVTSDNYVDLKAKAREVARLDHETREMLLAL